MAEKNASYTFKDERIFTTGAHLAPMEITKENGEVVLMWVVSEFTDDSFMDGRTVLPMENSDNLDDLIDGGTDEDDEDEL